MQTPLVNPIINLERPLEKVLKKGEYIAIKCHNTPGDNISGSYEINLPYYGGGIPEEWLVWKDKLLKALDGQSISTGPLRYTLDIGIHTVENFNKVLMEMTKHAFPAYAFHEQKSFLRRHLVKPRSIKLRSFISRLLELNAYLEEFPPDTVGHETGSLPAEEFLDVIYHSMPTT